MTRGIGDVLAKEDIVDQVSFQNLPGGGGIAISHLIETAKHQQNTLMVALLRLSSDRSTAYSPNLFGT